MLTKRFYLLVFLFLASCLSGRTQVGVASYGVAPENVVALSQPPIIWRVRPESDAVKEVRLTLNDKPIPGVYDPMKYRVVGTVERPLAPGSYNVHCELVTDKGRTFTKLWTFTVDPRAKPKLPPPTASAREMLAEINRLREKIGLPRYGLDPSLSAAANEYVKQIATGQTNGDAAALVQKYGFPGVCLEAVGGGFHPITTLIDDFFDAPYQRTLFLLPDACEVGCGWEKDQNQGSVFTLLFCMPESEVVVLYPMDGQKGVPLRWQPDSEEMSPLRVHGVKEGHGPVGYPITLTAVGPYGGMFTLVKATLMTSDGVAVPCYLNTPQNDRTNLEKGVIMVPKQPLKPGTVYKVSISAEDEHEEPFVRRWQFTTGGK